ncbi:MAG TPA: right-handed parallel beta-helix repeat-containing protein, partial [Cytophagaceae bacterium]|nr:right-handed parallel beta-helix repeat-containing protein [Cytophagaceae bacterium]
MKKCFLLSFFVLLCIAAKLSAATIYVNGNYTGSTEDGTSWATPYKTLDAAIANAAPNDQIWVAKGTYLAPNDNYNSLQGFYINKNLSIYGSFGGDETSIFERDLANDSTYLETYPDGSSGITGSIINVDKNIMVTLDGFCFKNYSIAIDQHYDALPNRTFSATPSDRFNITLNNSVFYNGVMPLWFDYFGDVDVSNTVFRYTNGTIHFSTSNVSPDDGSTDARCNFKFTNSSFSGNIGPGFQSNRANLTFLKCHFFNNNASSIWSSTSGDITVTDCEFNNNSADMIAVINHAQTGKVTIQGCNFHDNGGYSIVQLRLVSIQELDIQNTIFNNSTNTIFSTDAPVVNIDNVTVSNCNVSTIYAPVFSITGAYSKTNITN